ncbi:GNAT family N-acetyltransferase [Variovorax sp. V512]|uniref:GNAT family N-acetyltransferase n=2 Tax=Variovorax TaxID=34072 RepID=UPI0034E8933D
MKTKVSGYSLPKADLGGAASLPFFQMENITITAATPEELRSGELGRKLRLYNHGFVGEYPEQQYIRLNARDGNGRLLGGLRSFVFLYWLNIEVLFVEADVRGSGLGSRLLTEAERQAIELGATNAKLDTFEWQAPAFYLKHGYKEYARVDHYASGFYLASMKKLLAH